MKNILLVISFIGLNILVGDSNAAGKNSKDKGTAVTIHAVDQNLPNLLAILAEESGYNIVTGPNVNQSELLTIHLDNVSIDEAINLIVRAAGLSYEIVGNSILVANAAKLDKDIGVTPHVISLQYASADEVSRLLLNITDQITVDKTGNNLLVNASPKKIAEIEKIVSEIDVPATQIMLEAKLIEVGLTDDDKFGIDWAKLAQLSVIFAETGEPVSLGGSNETGSLFPGLSSNLQTNTDGELQVIETLNPTTYGQLPDEMYFQRLNSDNEIGLARQLTAFDVTLDFLVKNNKADILANSQVVTLNGHEATISMVDIVPYILSSGGVGGQVQVQREEIGIKLNVLPTVNSDGFITTKVTPEVSSIYDFIGPDRNIPWVKKRSSSTTIRVKNDESIVIAGLLSADKKKVQSKFPLLWRIPFIGPKFFTHTSEIENKTDLIIQITPKIVKDNYTGIEMGMAHGRLERTLGRNEKEEALYQLVVNVTEDSTPEDIKELQKALDMKDDEIDGKWSDETQQKLKKYLRKNEK